MRLRLYRGLGGHSKRGNGATARAWGLLSPLGVRYDDRLAVLFDDPAYGSLSFQSCHNRDQRLSGKQRRESGELGADIDAAVRPAARNIERVPGAHFFTVNFTFRSFQHHHSVTGERVVDLTGVQNGMKVPLGHEIFIADFAGIEAGSAEA